MVINTHRFLSAMNQNLDFDISAWKDYKFSPLLENAIRKQKFSKPSQIQEQALPLGLAGRDVVGVAETVCIYGALHDHVGQARPISNEKDFYFFFF